MRYAKLKAKNYWAVYSGQTGLTRLFRVTHVTEFDPAIPGSNSSSSRHSHRANGHIPEMDFGVRSCNICTPVHRFYYQWKIKIYFCRSYWHLSTLRNLAFQGQQNYPSTAPSSKAIALTAQSATCTTTSETAGLLLLVVVLSSSSG